MSLAHWGNTRITGRGLLGLVGKGQVHQIKLKADEEYVVHPNNVIAYSLGQYAPQPYRFKSTSLKLQVPSLSSLLPDTRFWREMRNTKAWLFVANTLFHLRTWARRSIWGDRLFLQFKGPTTILVQSRGSRITDSLSFDDINEIADTPAGSAREPVKLDLRESQNSTKPRSSQQTQPSEQIAMMKYATVGPDHKVVIK